MLKLEIRNIMYNHDEAALKKLILKNCDLSYLKDVTVNCVYSGSDLVTLVVRNRGTRQIIYSVDLKHKAVFEYKGLKNRTVVCRKDLVL